MNGVAHITTPSVDLRAGSRKQLPRFFYENRQHLFVDVIADVSERILDAARNVARLNRRWRRDSGSGPWSDGRRRHTGHEEARRERARCCGGYRASSNSGFGRWLYGGQNCDFGCAHRRLLRQNRLYSRDGGRLKRQRCDVEYRRSVCICCTRLGNRLSGVHQRHRDGIEGP